MEGYSADVERKMQRFFGWLSEKDRRRYAAVEAAKLGHGGIEYIARVLACDPQTIRQGLRDLEDEEDAAAVRDGFEERGRQVCGRVCHGSMILVGRSHRGAKRPGWAGRDLMGFSRRRIMRRKRM